MPLGVCINMDGTAIYLGICALFFSQAYGIELAAHDYLMLILTCTLGSIGAAGIPSGSIIFMGMVLTSVGLPIEGIGISLPGTGEEPAAPVFIDGKKAKILRGPHIADEFMQMVQNYVETTYAT